MKNETLVSNLFVKNDTNGKIDVFAIFQHLDNIQECNNQTKG